MRNAVCIVVDQFQEKQNQSAFLDLKYYQSKVFLFRIWRVRKWVPLELAHLRFEPVSREVRYNRLIGLPFHIQTTLCR